MEEAQRIPKECSTELLKQIGKTVKEYFNEHNLDLGRANHLLKLIYYDIKFEEEYD